MKSEKLITKKMTDIIVQICFDVVEFSRLHEQDHPNSAKKIFQSNEDVKKGLKWFMNSENTTELHNNIEAYLQSAKTALQLYENLNIPIEGKDKLLIQLTNLQTHLMDLQKEVHINS